jgi:hypothetical protein
VSYESSPNLLFSFIKFILVASSNLRIGFLSDPYHSLFLTKLLYASPLSQACCLSWRYYLIQSNLDYPCPHYPFCGLSSHDRRLSMTWHMWEMMWFCPRCSNKILRTKQSRSFYINDIFELFIHNVYNNLEFYFILVLQQSIRFELSVFFNYPLKRSLPLAPIIEITL